MFWLTSLDSPKLSVFCFVECGTDSVTKKEAKEIERKRQTHRQTETKRERERETEQNP